MKHFLIRPIAEVLCVFGFVCAWATSAPAQTAGQPSVPLQPFAQQVRQIETALDYLGQPLSPADQSAINAAIANPDEAAAVSQLERVLDKYALALVDINPESRVKVAPGPAKPELVEAGTRIFLAKVNNAAGVTAKLEVDSPNAAPVYVRSDSSAEPPEKITLADVKDRWLDASFFDKPPMSERLSGLPLEYRILEIYSRDAGQRSAKLSFSVGQGTQDIGFRNDIVLLFNAQAAHPLRLRVHDENGEPTFASFTIRDPLGRLYPNPSKRLAPDFFFQPQVYRSDGDTLRLPEGPYTVTCSLGPEYHAQTKKVDVGGDRSEVSFAMQRWIDPAKYRWYSGDHHVHAAGCAHYQNPTQGVRPEDMIRQILGEKLNVGCVLTWGPCYYYQKRFFSGKDNALSKRDELMHYDLEVSGFPSSHAGHLVLLGLTEQDYPGTRRIEDWPTWDLPILRWGKAQHAVVGFAHSGWGLGVKTSDLPNYEMPGFDGIGANEYIVDVTYPDAVDFISTMDTPDIWELNIWYHTLNVGFRARISGETDFPCITDSRVGQGRVYGKVEGPLSYSAWLQALHAGRSYVSEGKSHLMDFSVNGTEVGTHSSEVQLAGAGAIHATVEAAAYLDPAPNPAFQNLPYDHGPYWDIERARLGTSREVPVELIVNGTPAARRTIVADGKVNRLTFNVPVERSSWVAVRILGSSHTNPLFVMVGGKPIRASRRSAEWCLAAVNQCWTQKAPKISKREFADAQEAYDHAREVYKKLIDECQ